MKKFVNYTCVVAAMKVMDLRQKLAEQRVEGYVDIAIRILTAVVLDVLLLTGLYALFNDTVLPILVRRVQEMFDYTGQADSLRFGDAYPAGRDVSPSVVGGFSQ